MHAMAGPAVATAGLLASVYAVTDVAVATPAFIAPMLAEAGAAVAAPAFPAPVLAARGRATLFRAWSQAGHCATGGSASNMAPAPKTRTPRGHLDNAGD